MPENRCALFQKAVDNNLIRHRSILDIMSKLQEANARLNRAITKAVTSCGCVQIHAERQHIPADLVSYLDLKDYMESHLEGELCEACREAIENELGRCLFYYSAMLNIFDVKFDDILDKELDRLNTLGIYRLT